MDDSENLAYQHLTSLGLGRVIYEPDGKGTTPDFLVDGRIAVEVRRLNQNYASEIGTRGLEEMRIPLWKTMTRLLASLGPPTTGKSWFVSYGFRRPVATRAKLERAIRACLEDFRNGLTVSTEFDITENFHLRLLPASSVHSACFILGGYTDRDAGGWVIPELEKNIRICSDKKRQKVARVRAKYSVWWLVLIDYFNYGQQEIIQVTHDWDKLIVVNPLDPICAYEV